MALLALAVLILVAGSGGPSSPVRTARSEPTRDRASLLAFLAGLRHEPRLQWNANASACDWVGVRCDSGRTAVLELRLPGAGLLGSVEGGSLGRLSGLRVLSLRSNRLSGPIPAELAELAQLQRLFLQGNLFSGEIPAGLVGLTLLLRLDLSRNNLTGPVPFALNNLTSLRGLFLENNNLSGSLPSISIASLKHFNVSYNKLNGSVPRSLEGFPASSFMGNLDLCGAPLAPCEPFFRSPAAAPAAVQVPTQRSSKRLSTAAIIGIIVASIAVFLVLLLLVVCVVFRLRRKGASRTKEKSAKGTESGTRATAATAGGRSGETGMTSSSKDEMSGSASALVEAERNKLVFVGSGAAEYSFDLEDLLRASAEVLGKGTTGTSYKAVLEEGSTVVVKRLKDVTAAKPEFDALMHTLGQTERPNLVAPRAYYYSKDEKLVVLDYLPAGSLSSLLHGSRGTGRPPLGWESRMRVALAAGRGLAHLHTSAHLVHGNIKASNVLLRAGDHDSAALSDFALHPIFHPALRIRPAGYLAPEVLETRRPTFKSDVYSFGVLLLELLTGKAPNQASLNEEGIDLPRWVQSVVREEWTAEVFDAELMRYADTEEEEMVQLLQIAMACVSATPDARPEIAEVVRTMEQIANRTEGNDGPKSSQADPAMGAGDVVGGDAVGATS